jgi:hypothetical protein
MLPTDRVEKGLKVKIVAGTTAVGAAVWVGTPRVAVKEETGEVRVWPAET